MGIARVGATLALVVGGLSGCGHAAAPPPARTPPDLQAFLRLPVATPSACPSSRNGTTSGRRSPWVGHVDVSVYLDATATPAQSRALGAALRADRDVARVYFEPRWEAYAEFQRLYTCSAAVPRSAVPASYRLILRPVTRTERDALVRRIYALPGVGTVSCDPASPCVNIRP